MSNITACATGVYDCNYEGIPASELLSCTDYNNEYIGTEGDVWAVIVAGAS
jgi:hypothetical protein